MQTDTDSQLDTTIAAIVARHKLRTRTWTRLELLGTATTIYLLDDVYVLRVPHTEAIAGICNTVSRWRAKRLPTSGTR